jgi:hypothetical protein
MVLSSAILLGFADRTKIAGKSVGPPEAKKSNPPADSTQPTNKLWPKFFFDQTGRSPGQGGLEPLNPWPRPIIGTMHAKSTV